MNEYVDCSKVYVGFLKEKGFSVFAKDNIKKGDLVEKGIACLIDIDGNNNSHLFTWSEDRTKWAHTSGCATFYNTSLQPNCVMNRDFENNVFTISALKNIEKGEELNHLYRSLQWRTCFKDLNTHLQKTE